MKYFVLNSNNDIIAVLDNQPQSLPPGMTAVRYNGFVPVRYLKHADGIITPASDAPEAEIALDEAKRQAIKEMMNLAAKLFQQVRAKYYFNVVGYEEVFREKVEEAIDCLSAGNEDASKFPLLKSESDVLSVSVIDIAKNILQRRSDFIQQTAVIDKHMNQTQFDIEECDSLSKLTNVRNQALVEFTQLEIDLNRV